MDNIHKLYGVLQSADAVVIGAGAGLSTSAGFTYSGERFEKYFADFIEKYGFTDMYTAGFHAFLTEEEKWAYWSRHIYYNRYVPAPKPVYDNLLKLLKGKVLYWDLGIGSNTPTIIKLPFMQMTYKNPEAIYATVNLGEAFTVDQIKDRSIVIDADINEVLNELLSRS